MVINFLSSGRCLMRMNSACRLCHNIFAALSKLQCWTLFLMSDQCDSQQSQILRCLSYHQSWKPPKDRYRSSLIPKTLPVYNNCFIWALFLTSIFLILQPYLISFLMLPRYFNLYSLKAHHGKRVTDYFCVLYNGSRIFSSALLYFLPRWNSRCELFLFLIL